MKTHIFKRLSALMAGFAVALVGSLSALPQAHAATTYTLDKVGGTATVTSLTYRGEPVGGRLPNGQHVNGQTMPKYGFGTGKTMVLSVNVSVTDASKLAGGDKITIPLSYPAATQSAVNYGQFSCSGDLVTGAVSVSCNSSNIVLTMSQDVALADFSGTIPVSFFTDRSGVVTEYVYVQNQFVGVQGSVYEIDTEPGGDETSVEATAASWNTNWYAGVTMRQRNGYLDSYSSTRRVAVLNHLLRGDWDSTTSDVTSNLVEVVHMEAPYGLTASNLRLQDVYPKLAQKEGDTEYFTTALRWGKYTGIDSVMTRVSIPEGVLGDKPELAKDLLKPGQYAWVENTTDGSVDLAFNWGPYYNNPVLTTPVADIPAVGAFGITAKEREKYVWLAEHGYNNRVPLYYFDLTPDNNTVSQLVPYTHTIYRVSDSTITDTRKVTDSGYYDAAMASGSGALLQAALGYNKNGSDVTGTGPAAASGVVGATVNVANQGAWKRTGYNFDGWNTAADGSGTAYAVGDSLTLPREGVALYAQWKALPDTVPSDQPQPDGYVKVTFAPGTDGTLSGTTSYWVNPTKSVTVTAPTVTANTGFVFDKWDKALTQKFTAATTITAQYKVEELVEIYRMYDGIEHLYVNTTTERDALVARGWKYEGVAFSTPKTSSTAVHRLFQPATGDHHYTSDSDEIAALTSKHGWRDEGVLFYGDDAKRVELKRLFMPGLGKGEHLHTADPNELEALTTKHGWKLEGISFYVAKYGE